MVSLLDPRLLLVNKVGPIEILTENTCMNSTLIVKNLYSKIAPQNIMYDRRVVRGNTFAALVIPVSKILRMFKFFRYAARPSSD
jgi:hypothetical protein